MDSMSQLYVDEIVNSLVKGHASVLIGAGFSKNADPANELVKGKMPDWSQLSDTFCEKIGITDQKDKKYLNSLAVAQEVEVTYGRPFLNNLIIDQMQNDLYKPSDIHINLMRLPWTDVFTTNYDTLLERACSQVTERKYHVVVDQNDLLYSCGQARIVKLHGSFPSNGPFIINEEDFRTYPYDHAPFVNTVQQSLLENTFCTMGFSGDDPNFLKWIGWIHDNLGIKNSPKIYMISHKTVLPAKAKSFAAKNIEIVVLNEIENYQDNNIVEAYRKFLNDLIERVEKQKDLKTKWPGHFNISYAKVKDEDYYKQLKSLHDAYPGWIIAPYRKHNMISLVIRGDGFFYAKYKIEREFELEICYEDCWFNDILGRPLFKSALNALKVIIERHSDKKDSKEYKYILLSMLHAFRIHGSEEDWDKYYFIMKELRLDKDENNKFIFEDIIHQIYTFKYDTLNKMIDSITTDDNQSEWALRKSGLLAMVGRYSEAEVLIKECLTNIRYVVTQNSDVHSIRYLSIESCLVSLYNYVIQARNSAEGAYNTNIEDFIEELEKNGDVDFIWRNENTHYEDVLSDKYAYIMNESETPEFDIGRATYSANYSDDKDALNAYEFLYFREITGIPFRLGNVVFKNGVLGASKRLSPYNQRYPLVLATLTSQTNIIEESCTRLYLSNMPHTNVDSLCDICIDSLQDSMKSYDMAGKTPINTSLREYPLQVMPEILSRLCSKCSEEKFESLVDLLLEVYFYQHKRSISKVKKLLERVIKCIPFSKLIGLLDKFWAFPLFIDDSWIKVEYPDPFNYIFMRVKEISKIAQKKENYKLSLNSSESAQLEKLFKSTDDEELAKSAIRRITYLSQIYEFSSEQKAELNKILLNAKNLDSYGVPYVGDFYLSVIDEFVISNEKDKETNVSNKDRQLEYCENGLKNIVYEGTVEECIYTVRTNSWRKAIDEINKAATEDSLSQYDNILRNAQSLAQRYKLSEDEIIELISYLLVLCQKLDRYYEKGISLFNGKEAYNGIKEAAILISEALLNSGYVSEKEVYSNDNLVKIKNLLDKDDIPSSLLSWCMYTDGREENLINQLFQGKSSYIAEANNAIYRLSAYGYSIGNQTIDLLISSLITANSYNVNYYALALEYMIFKGILTDSQCNRISGTLTKFIEITAFEGIESNKVIADKLTLRMVISILANTLYHRYLDKKQEIPKGVKDWKILIESPDEFAEVRNCWDEA